MVLFQELAGAGSVGRGRAYGVCRCQGEERQGAERCVVAQSLDMARVVCDDGYTLSVRRLRERSRRRGWRAAVRPACLMQSGGLRYNLGVLAHLAKTVRAVVCRRHGTSS